MNSFKIGNKEIGKHKKCYIIAEVAQAHDGSLGLAHSFIDAAAEAGADAIKFQTHIAEAESSDKDIFRVKFSYQDATRMDYWKRMEFTEEQWVELAKHANEKGLDFLSTPFSLEAVQLLDRIGMPAWKISSGEIFNPLIFNYLSESNNPLIVSTGMNTEKEIEEIVKLINIKGNDFALLQCTSMYPTPLEKVGLNVMQKYKRYSCPIGLSDHSGSIYPGLAAIAGGANILEVHVTFDKRMFGPDTIASVTFSELKLMVEAARAFYIMSMNPVEKDQVALELSGMRELFGKGIIVTEPLSAGTVLMKEHLSARKPMIGIPVQKIDNIIGKRLKNSVNTGQFLKWEDLYNEEA
jgi:N,N'-diacetyllegionaminate synthase